MHQPWSILLTPPATPVWEDAVRWLENKLKQEAHDSFLIWNYGMDLTNDLQTMSQSTVAPHLLI